MPAPAAAEAEPIPSYPHLPPSAGGVYSFPITEFFCPQSNRGLDGMVSVDALMRRTVELPRATARGSAGLHACRARLAAAASRPYHRTVPTPSPWIKQLQPFRAWGEYLDISLCGLAALLLHPGQTQDLAAGEPGSGYTFTKPAGPLTSINGAGTLTIDEVSIGS